MYYLLNLIKFFSSKSNHWKNEKKYWKSQEFCQSGKMGTMSPVNLLLPNYVIFADNGEKAT